MGISRDAIEANAAFAQKYQFSFSLLSDTTGEICQAYGACSGFSYEDSKRITYVIDPDGIIRHVYENVHPESHIETVLALLRSSVDVTHQNRFPISSQTPQTNLGGGVRANKKGAKENMDEPQDNVGTGTCATRSMVDTLLPSEQMPTVTPSQAPPTRHTDHPQLVFALGTLGYDFGTQSRRDSITQHMVGPDNPTPNPNEPAQLLAYLEANPDQAAALLWTINLDATPIYGVMPRGPFASTAYERLRQFLREQITEGVERISIAGVIIGQTRLSSGQVVPVILPELRCMYSWTTDALVETAVGRALAESAEDYAQRGQGVTNFLERIYHELRNLGLASQERAINYAATNAFNVKHIFESALKAKMELDTIEVERSPICRPDSDCWDVKLLFFDPENVLRSRRAYRFTVDVSDVCPVTVGEVRSWSVR